MLKSFRKFIRKIKLRYLSYYIKHDINIKSVVDFTDIDSLYTIIDDKKVKYHYIRKYVPASLLSKKLPEKTTEYRLAIDIGEFWFNRIYDKLVNKYDETIKTKPEYYWKINFGLMFYVKNIDLVNLEQPLISSLLYIPDNCIYTISRYVCEFSKKNICPNTYYSNMDKYGLLILETDDPALKTSIMFSGYKYIEL